MVQERNALGVGQAPPPPPPDAPPNEKLDYIAQQLYRLVEIGEKLIGEVPIVIEPKIIPAYALMTIEPKTITEFIEAVSPPGKTIGRRDIAFTMVAPAGTTNQYAFRMPSGWVSIVRTPFVFTSDFYDPGLTVEVWVEETRIPVTYGALPMTGPRTLDLSFRVKRYGMDYEIVNGTATDALITIEATGFWLEKSYYEEFYKPLIEKIYQAAEALIR